MFLGNKQTNPPPTKTKKTTKPKQKYYVNSYNFFASFMICNVFLIGPVPRVMWLHQSLLSLKINTFLHHIVAVNAWKYDS